MHRGQVSFDVKKAESVPTRNNEEGNANRHRFRFFPQRTGGHVPQRGRSTFETVVEQGATFIFTELCRHEMEVLGACIHCQSNFL